MKDTYLSLAFVHGSTTQHSSLYTAVKVTTWGFGEKKKKKKPPSGVCTPLCHAGFILALHAKFRVSINMIRSVLCDLIRDPIRDLLQVFWTLSNMSAQSYSQGINQKNLVGPFRYSDWLSR